MHQKIKKFIKNNDPVLFKILKEIGEIEEISPRQPNEYFFSLCRSIIGQQLSNKAADTIVGRFIELFPRKIVSPRYLLKLSDQKIRGVGTSWAKVKYLKDLAQKVKDKDIVLADLTDLENEIIIEKLTEVKGIGKWTAEMFLMFSLGREDVFSLGDLGLRRAIEKIYKIKNPTVKKIEKISLKWSPYRTWVSRILWNYRDIE